MHLPCVFFYFLYAYSLFSRFRWLYVTFYYFSCSRMQFIYISKKIMPKQIERSYYLLEWSLKSQIQLTTVR